mmetsp:Transcript_80364/g.157109  ORF Transcript_80364/g.157109 Transcript_80364/m.157109 type:complete len:219 (-) Transcript_80364:27-683(-)
MADIFSEVDWDSRLDPYNHAPHFPFSFTVITDTFPIFIEAPRDPFLNDLFYGGKYGRHCVKVGIGVTFQKKIVFWSGVHVGSASDTTIARDTIENSPRLPWEWWLGDRVYMFVRRCLAGYRRQRIPNTRPPRYYRLTTRQRECNGLIGFYRSRVEQVIGNCKNHNAMSKGGLAFRGSIIFLEAIVSVTMHATAAMLEREPRMQSHPFPNPSSHPGWAH